jgi:hypothetical protein
MKSISKNLAFFAVAVLGLMLILPQNAVAQDIPEKNTAQCCPSEKDSPSRGIATSANRLLAFGCRLNYQLTNWILDDKCNTTSDLCDFSRDTSLCE